MTTTPKEQAAQALRLAKRELEQCMHSARKGHVCFDGDDFHEALAAVDAALASNPSPAVSAEPAPAGLTDAQIATMRSDAWLVFNASEAAQEVRDVIEWYDGTLRAALTQEGSEEA